MYNTSTSITPWNYFSVPCVHPQENAQSQICWNQSQMRSDHRVVPSSRHSHKSMLLRHETDGGGQLNCCVHLGLWYKSRGLWYVHCPQMFVRNAKMTPMVEMLPLQELFPWSEIQNTLHSFGYLHFSFIFPLYTYCVLSDWEQSFTCIIQYENVNNNAQSWITTIILLNFERWIYQVNILLQLGVMFWNIHLYRH